MILLVWLLSSPLNLGTYFIIFYSCLEKSLSSFICQLVLLLSFCSTNELFLYKPNLITIIKWPRLQGSRLYFYCSSFKKIFKTKFRFNIYSMCSSAGVVWNSISEVNASSIFNFNFCLSYIVCFRWDVGVLFLSNFSWTWI